MSASQPIPQHLPVLTRRAFLRVTGAGAITAGAIWLSGCGDASEARGTVIEMNGLSVFKPAQVTIKVGQTVTWRNSSTIVHTVTCDPGKLMNPANARLPEGSAPWDSGTIPAGKSWNRTFDVPGEYRYCCVPHEIAGMIGTLIVLP